MRYIILIIGICGSIACQESVIQESSSQQEAREQIQKPEDSPLTDNLVSTPEEVEDDPVASQPAIIGGSYLMRCEITDSNDGDEDVSCAIENEQGEKVTEETFAQVLGIVAYPDEIVDFTPTWIDDSDDDWSFSAVFREEFLSLSLTIVDQMETSHTLEWRKMQDEG